MLFANKALLIPEETTVMETTVIETTVMGRLVLHNLLRTRYRDFYTGFTNQFVGFTNQFAVGRSTVESI